MPKKVKPKQRAARGPKPVKASNKPAPRQAKKPAPKTTGARKPQKAKAAVAPKPAKVAERPGKKPAAALPPAAASKPVVGGAPATPPVVRPLTPRTPGASKKSSRRYQPIRRGPDGEILAPGELLLPGGSQTNEEVQYFYRGCFAAEHPVPTNDAVLEIATKRNIGESDPLRVELMRLAKAVERRFESAIEPLLPNRPAGNRRTFQSVVERAKQRRREIGAFLRGLHLGRLETSHMDSHGEASLQSLMEWAARLENLAEADEPQRADYTQFHRGLDHLENTTESLIVDVERTLRRLRDRVMAS